MTVHEPESATTRNADGWFTPGRFALLLAGLIAATFSGVLLGQETFYYRDFGLFGYPLAHYQRECFWRGELPLWNPLNSCGLPFLAQWNTLTLYPPALFYLLFPLSWSLGVFNLAHLWLAGMGMYFLTQRCLANRLAASIAGVAFAFNGLTWHALMWPNDIAALGWMPWVVLAVERAWRGSVKSEISSNPPSSILHPRLVAIAALTGALQMLAGAPEIILLTWSLLGVLWLVQFSAGRISRKAMLLRSATVVALITGLSAAQLLPFLELLSHSHRSTGFTQGDEWAMPWSGPANFLVPQFHCYAASQGVFVQYGQYWVSSHYVGIGVIALALAGIFCVRAPRVWVLLGIALACIWMALGTQAYLYPIARKALPVLALMRYPIKFIVLPVFIVPMLAAYGVQWHQEQVAAGDSIRARNVLRNIALVLLGLMAVILFIGWKFPFIKDNWTVTWHRGLGRAAFLILTPAILFLANRAAQFNMQVLLRIGLIALLWADIYTHTPNPNPTVRRSVYESGLIRAALKLPPATPAEPRFMETDAVMKQIHVVSLSEPAEDYLYRRYALYDNCNLIDGISKLDGFYSLYLREALDVLALAQSADAQGMSIRGLKDFLGVAHISVIQTNAGQSMDWAIRDSFVPLMTIGQQPAFGEERSIAAGLIATNFDPRQTVFLPVTAQSQVKASRTAAKIISSKVQAQRLQAEVDAAAPTVLVIAQAFYPAWHAYVDGRRVNLWRANLGFQALEIPAGHHAVKVVYEDRVFLIGAIVSCGTWALVALMWLRRSV